jgi:hypothetical protein
MTGERGREREREREKLDPIANESSRIRRDLHLRETKKMTKGKEYLSQNGEIIWMNGHTLLVHFGWSDFTMRGSDSGDANGSMYGRSRSIGCCEWE